MRIIKHNLQCTQKYRKKTFTRISIELCMKASIHPTPFHIQILWQYKSKRLISSGKILYIRAINKKKTFHGCYDTRYKSGH